MLVLMAKQERLEPATSVLLLLKRESEGRVAVAPGDAVGKSGYCCFVAGGALGLAAA
jgi:hypothetical protein